MSLQAQLARVVALFVCAALNLAPTDALADAAKPQNFAVGGATSGASSAVSVADPVVAGIVTSAGLQVQGLTRQIDLASATQHDFDPDLDVAVLIVGGNDYIFFGSDPSEVVGRIDAALERLWSDLGARHFVVFNLIPLGESPLTTLFPPGASAGLNAAAAAHNALLATRLTAFEQSHPGARIALVDSSDAFASLGNPPFSIPGPATCVGLVDFAVPMPIPLPPGGCGPFIWMDGVHLTSGAVGELARRGAQALRARIGATPVRSLYTFGDSFADTGSLRDTVLRANLIVGNPPLTAPNGPAYFNGRFADGPNLIDQLETELGVQVASSFFPQPLSLQIALTPGGPSPVHVEGSSDPSITGRAFIPSTLTAIAQHGPSLLHLDFGQTRCIYVARPGKAEYAFVSCSKRARPGDLVTFTSITARAAPASALTIELLFYE